VNRTNLVEARAHPLDVHPVVEQDAHVGRLAKECGKAKRGTAVLAQTVGQVRGRAEPFAEPPRQPTAMNCWILRRTGVGQSSRSCEFESAPAAVRLGCVR
jgi:hypothetical protein